MRKPLYGNRDVTAMPLKAYYNKHFMHITMENLMSKTDIASELAIRDMRIDELERKLEGGNHD